MAKKVDDLKLKNDVLQGMITEINESISAFDVAEEKNIYRLLGRIETISGSFDNRLRDAREDQQRRI